MSNRLTDFLAQAKQLELSIEEREMGKLWFRSGMHLIDQGDTLTLSEREKSEGFDQLMGALTNHPIVLETTLDRVLMFLRATLIRLPVAAVLVFMVGGGALALAAEATTPGDALYPIKVSITEPLVGVFRGTSKKNQAEWSMKLLQRRLDEAEAVATTPNAQRRSDPVAKALRQQTSEFLSAIDTLLPGEENETLRREALRQFEARAHHVTSRARDDSTAHDIIRAILDERGRLEKATQTAEMKTTEKSSSSKHPAPGAAAQERARLRIEKDVKGILGEKQK